MVYSTAAFLVFLVEQLSLPTFSTFQVLPPFSPFFPLSPPLYLTYPLHLLLAIFIFPSLQDKCLAHLATRTYIACLVSRSTCSAQLSALVSAGVRLGKSCACRRAVIPV